DSLKDIRQCFHEWKTTRKQLEELRASQNNRIARIEFLKFQLNELDELALTENEYQTLNEEHQKLANIDQDLLQANEAIEMMREGENLNLQDTLGRVQQIMQK